MVALESIPFRNTLISVWCAAANSAQDALVVAVSTAPAPVGSALTVDASGSGCGEAQLARRPSQKRSPASSARRYVGLKEVIVRTHEPSVNPSTKVGELHSVGRCSACGYGRTVGADWRARTVNSEFGPSGMPARESRLTTPLNTLDPRGTFRGCARAGPGR